MFYRPNVLRLYYWSLHYILQTKRPVGYDRNGTDVAIPAKVFGYTYTEILFLVYLLENLILNRALGVQCGCFDRVASFVDSFCY